MNLTWLVVISGITIIVFLDSIFCLRHFIFYSFVLI
ncbi:MAG: hypothetical protein ACI8RD_014405 [Bacillariaceae sp.]|jgi:hypothetical protein